MTPTIIGRIQSFIAEIACFCRWQIPVAVSVTDGHVSTNGQPPRNSRHRRPGSGWRSGALCLLLGLGLFVGMQHSALAVVNEITGTSTTLTKGGSPVTLTAADSGEVPLADWTTATWSLTTDPEPPSELIFNPPLPALGRQAIQVSAPAGTDPGDYVITCTATDGAVPPANAGSATITLSVLETTLTATVTDLTVLDSGVAGQGILPH